MSFVSELYNSSAAMSLSHIPYDLLAWSSRCEKAASLLSTGESPTAMGAISKTCHQETLSITKPTSKDFKRVANQPSPQFTMH